MSGTLLSNKDLGMCKTHLFAQGNNSLVIALLPIKSPQVIFSTLSFFTSIKMLLNLVRGENLYLFMFSTIHLTLPSFISYTLNHSMHFQCSLLCLCACECAHLCMNQNLSKGRKMLNPISQTGERGNRHWAIYRS